MSSSISLFASPDELIRTQVSVYSPSTFAGDTNTTWCLRVWSSLPMTTWWPYRASACRALGMSSEGSVSSYRPYETRHNERLQLDLP